jgi:hypothetical protein
MGSSEKQSGSGTFFKVFLGVILGGIALMILVCGGLYWFARSAVKMTQIPAEVQQIADSIARISIPEGYSPTGGMTMNLGASVKMAIFERKAEGKSGQLMLMQMNVPGGGVSDQQVRQSLDQQMQQSGKDGSITVKSRATRSFQIDGQARDFEFIEGTEPKTNAEVRQVVGTFPGREGMAILMLREAAAGWDEAAAVKMLESISTK